MVEAHLANGLLHVDLRREIPEAMKPRKVEIRSAAPTQGRLVDATEVKAAA